MKMEIINSANATRAAEFLLLLDNSAIVKPYQQNARTYTQTLQQAFNSYQLLLQKSYLVMFTQKARMVLVQKNLESLIRYTAYLSQILIPEAQEKLVDYLTHPETPRSYVKISFKEASKS